MTPQSFLTTLMVVFSTIAFTAAAPGSVCASGIYKDLLCLAAYPPAESFCSAHYPVPAVTVTITPGVHRREPVNFPTPVKRNIADASLWSSILYEASGILGTVCSCIETPATTTVTKGQNTTHATITSLPPKTTLPPFTNTTSVHTTTFH